MRLDYQFILINTQPDIDTWYQTSNNAMTVILKTDRAGQKHGFLMDWKSQGPGCGNQLIHADDGEIKSEGFDQVRHKIYFFLNQKLLSKEWSR